MNWKKYRESAKATECSCLFFVLVCYCRSDVYTKDMQEKKSTVSLHAKPIASLRSRSFSVSKHRQHPLFSCREKDQKTNVFFGGPDNGTHPLLLLSSSSLLLLLLLLFLSLLFWYSRCMSPPQMLRPKIPNTVSRNSAIPATFPKRGIDKNTVCTFFTKITQATHQTHKCSSV